MTSLVLGQTRSLAHSVRSQAGPDYCQDKIMNYEEVTPSYSCHPRPLTKLIDEMVWILSDDNKLYCFVL